jgi:hypothetical protein
VDDLDRRLRLHEHGRHGLFNRCCRRWSRRRGRGRFGTDPGEALGRFPVHRVRHEEAIEPLRGGAEPLVALGDFGEHLEGEDVLGIELQDTAEYHVGAGVVFLVDETPSVHDMTADVVGVELQASLAELDGVIYKPCLAIRISERREIPPLGILPVARFELLDLAGVGHVLSLCGNWPKIVIGRPTCQCKGGPPA